MGYICQVVTPKTVRYPFPQNSIFWSPLQITSENQPALSVHLTHRKASIRQGGTQILLIFVTLLLTNSKVFSGRESALNPILNGLKPRRDEQPNSQYFSWRRSGHDKRQLENRHTPFEQCCYTIDAHHSYFPAAISWSDYCDHSIRN